MNERTEHVPVLFIAGSGRSGSTLLERMLGQIDGFAAIGELRHLWRQDFQRDLCGCGLPFRECPFWAPLLADILGPRPDFPRLLALRGQVDRIRHIPRILAPWQSPGFRAAHAEYTGLLSAIYKSVRQRSGGKIVIDSSKDVSTLYLLSRMRGIDLHVVHLVRDSRAVAFSWQRKRLQPGKAGRERYMARYSARKAGWDWLYRQALTEAASPLVQTYRRVHYEALIARPRAELLAICEQVGLEKAQLGFLEENIALLSRDAHTVSGNPMRFRKGETPLVLDDIWRKELDRRDRRLVSMMTAVLLKRYGYSIRV